ncbi:MAG: hypothetical protein AB8I69_17635 [Anaerolineae bacterium]
MGCERLKPSSIAGYLQPAYPIAMCATSYEHIAAEVHNVGEAMMEQCTTSPDSFCSRLDAVMEDACVGMLSPCDNIQDAVEQECKTPEDICDSIQGIVGEEQYQLGLVEHIAASGKYAYNPEGAFFFDSGGFDLVYYQYVIIKDEQFLLIETEDEFREIYAPIETSEEALAYVEAVTGLFHRYGLGPDIEGSRWITDVVEDTHIETVEDGYLVHLFHFGHWGCAPHYMSAVEFHVTSEGRVRQIKKEPIYEDMRLENTCID